MKTDTFAYRLSTALEKRNIDAEELSLKSGVSVTQITAYLNGRFEAKPIKVALLAESLRINKEWLMGYDVPMEQEIQHFSPSIESQKELMSLLSTLSQLDQSQLSRVEDFAASILENQTSTSSK